MCYRGRGLSSAQLPTAKRGKSIVTCIIMIRPVAEDRRYNGSVQWALFAVLMWRTVSGEPWVIREWTPNLRGSGLRNALQPLSRIVSLRGDLRPNAGKRYRGGPAVIYGGLSVILALLVTKAGHWTLPGAMSIALVIGTSRLTLALHTGPKVAAGGVRSVWRPRNCNTRGRTAIRPADQASCRDGAPCRGCV